MNIGEYSSRAIFSNIHEPEANNCFSITTQVIIKIPKQSKSNLICHCHPPMNNYSHRSHGLIHHCQNDKCFSHILKILPLKKAKKEAKIVSKSVVKLVCC